PPPPRSSCSSHPSPSRALVLSFSSGYGDQRHLPSFPTRRSSDLVERELAHHSPKALEVALAVEPIEPVVHRIAEPPCRRLRIVQDRKSTRLNSSHVKISYAVFCLKKKTDSAAAGRRQRALQRDEP